MEVSAHEVVPVEEAGSHGGGTVLRNVDDPWPLGIIEFD